MRHCMGECWLVLLKKEEVATKIRSLMKLCCMVLSFSGDDYILDNYVICLGQGKSMNGSYISH